VAVEKKDWDAYNTYQDGKMKRYTLLFSINGGAYAIVTWVAEHMGAAERISRAASLKPIAVVVAIAASLFTALMCVDLWLFGRMMKKAGTGVDLVYFGEHGKAVLASIVLILLVAWVGVLALVDFRFSSIPVFAGLAAIVWIEVESDHSRDRKLITLVALATILSLGHTVDHVLRGDLHWPLTPESILFIVVTLGTNLIAGGGVYLYMIGKIGPRFWASVLGIGLVAGWLGHFSPLSDQPPHHILGAYACAAVGWFALGWLIMLMLVLSVATVYATHHSIRASSR
jgi:hypothetical protein